MAKVGEGDPRWIVAERQDGTNVNAWHWEERDITKSAHEKLKAALQNVLVYNDEAMSLEFVELSEIDGDVTVAQRKGKIMCYFEIKGAVKWSGTIKNGEEKKVEGKITFPEIDHDTFQDDFPINVSMMEHDSHSKKAENIIQTEGRKTFRKIISEFFENLFKENRVGSKITDVPNAPSTISNVAAKTLAPVENKVPSVSKPSLPEDRVSLSWSMHWGVPPEVIFQAFMDERIVSEYTRCLAKIDPRPQGQFSFFGGSISGYYTDIKPNEKIAMQWKLSSWNKFCTVILDFKKEEACMTRLDFAMAGILPGEYSAVSQGWRSRFFEPIKSILGYPLTWVDGKSDE